MVMKVVIIIIIIIALYRTSSDHRCNGRHDNYNYYYYNSIISPSPRIIDPTGRHNSSRCSPILVVTTVPALVLAEVVVSRHKSRHKSRS